MKYMDIYNGVTNPLDEDRVLDILAQAYSQRHFGLGGFYSQLVTTTEKEYKGRYNPEEYNKFYATAFNKWKMAGSVLIPGVLNIGDINKTDGCVKARELADKLFK